MDAFNLLDTTYITVAVRFFNEDECAHRETGKTYNYKAPRTAGIEVGDLLVVPATQTLRIVKVAEVHAEPQFNGLPNLKWIVQKVDRTEYDANLERERKFRDALQEVERVRKRDELIHTLTTTAAGSEAAKTLLGEALTMIGAVPAPVADMAFRDPPAGDTPAEPEAVAE